MREWCVSYDLKVWSYCLMMFECMSGRATTRRRGFCMEVSSIAGRELGRKKSEQREVRMIKYYVPGTQRVGNTPGKWNKNGSAYLDKVAIDIKAGGY